MEIDPWPGLELGDPLGGGSRSEVWAGLHNGQRAVVRQSRRSAASLEWELDLMDTLAAHGFVVPAAIPTDDGRRSVDGLVVQTWIDGRPPISDDDWRLVATELQRLHTVGRDHRQRPECCVVTEIHDTRRSVDADLDSLPTQVAALVLAEFASVAHVGRSLIHGDPGPENLRITAQGRVGLLDWDESRVDVVWHDLSNLGVQVLDDDTHGRAERLSHAWEAANGWTTEPEYARRRLAALDQ
ncbi:MAG: phosphotransferase [Actinomycetota bacterium]